MEAAMQERDVTVCSVRFVSEEAARPRRVRAPQGIEDGAIIEVDLSIGVRLLYGKELPPLPRWAECEVVRTQQVLGVDALLVTPAFRPSRHQPESSRC